MADSANQLESGATALSNAEFFTPAYLEKRRRAIEKLPGPKDLDVGDPKGPSGHAYAIRKSTWLTSTFRQTHRKGAMNITPRDVMEVLNAAGVKDWVLMGLHGYVGYMPQPRATQDVDVLVPQRQRTRAQKAIAEKWPSLEVEELSQVIRFKDPVDIGPDGKPKPVVDLMLPWSPIHESVLREDFVDDVESGFRLPTVEAASVSLLSLMRSTDRDRCDKEQDAGDFRRIARANHDRLDSAALRRLAALVWEDGADEIERFIDIALSDEPFPI